MRSIYINIYYCYYYIKNYNNSICKYCSNAEKVINGAAVIKSKTTN